MSDSGARILYEFNDFRLDPQQRLLLTAAGEPIPLAPKVFETLLYFIERRGELLDKGALLKAVWPNVVVEENSLNQNISALRRALKESPGEHRFIVTEPGRGYRWVAEVRVATSTPATGRPAAAPAPPAKPGRSIAVLPFANLTGDPGKDYLGDGLAEELIHTLARLPGVRVPSRTSAFAYKGRNVDMRQIAKDLEVSAVLEGSVRTAGERIRVTAQLIDGETGYHRWSQSYDREIGDLFKLQDELAQAIVTTLRLSLEGYVPSAALQIPPTQNVEAYHLYLKAMATQVAANPAGIGGAIEMLQRALRLDPGFARAHSGLATMRALGIVMDVGMAMDLEDVEAEIERAIGIHPETGATHGALGTIRAARGHWVEAEASFQMALRLDPDDPFLQQSYGVFLAGSVGHTSRFVQAELRAHELAPAWLVNLMSLAVAYYTAGQFEDARRYMKLALDLGIAKHAGPVGDVLSQFDIRDGRFEEAGSHFNLAQFGNPPDINVAALVATVMSAMGDASRRAAAVEALDRLRAASDPLKMPQFVKRRLTAWYTMLGSNTQAFEVANQTLDQFATTDTIGTAWSFYWMPEMRPFRQDARFQALVARFGFPAYWDRFGPPDGCEWRGGRLICG